MIDFVVGLIWTSLVVVPWYFVATLSDYNLLLSMGLACFGTLMFWFNICICVKAMRYHEVFNELAANHRSE